MNKSKILYTEDDESISFLVKEGLKNHYEVLHCKDGTNALKLFKTQDFDLCLLDIMIPKIDGFDVAKEIRKSDAEIPIIFLSAKTLKEDRIKGLKLGADDYLVKPFSMEELILKIEIFLKRSKKSTKIPETIEIGNYQFDIKNYTLTKENKILKLTQREAELLVYFLKNKNSVLKREDILTALWGEDDYFLGRSLDVFISRLRKIFSEESGVHIENLHGIGFKFVLK